MEENLPIPVDKMDIGLDEASLLEKARRTGFIKRLRKFGPTDFIRTLCLMALYTATSLEIFASCLGLVAHTGISKQALDKRIHSGGCIDFVRSILLALTLRGAGFEPLKEEGAFAPFKRVHIQDSFNINLPQTLADVFPGAGNQNKRSATLKLQVIYELIQESFIHFGLSGYTRNDQSASTDILQFAQPGDLILRDLGYFSLNVFDLLVQRGIYFLTPYWHKVALYEQSGERINLLGLVERHSTVDTLVFVGSERRLPLRLIATPVPDNIAQIRRRNLLSKKNRDTRLNPTKEQLQLLGWDIFLTNVDVWDTKTASKVYGLRWRIEIIFKSWRSHFHIDSLPNKAGREHIELLIYSKLIFICLFQSCFAHLDAYSRSTASKPISLLKLAQFAQVHLWAILFALLSPQMARLVLEQILKHCVYERRLKRRNFHEKLSALLS